MCVCNDEHFVRWSSKYLISGLDGELVAFNPHTGEIAPLKTYTKYHGYVGVTIQYKYRTCTTGLHRLVWAYHNGVIPSGMVIDHNEHGWIDQED